MGKDTARTCDLSTTRARCRHSNRLAHELSPLPTCPPLLRPLTPSHNTPWAGSVHPKSHVNLKQTGCSKLFKNSRITNYKKIYHKRKILNMYRFLKLISIRKKSLIFKFRTTYLHNCPRLLKLKAFRFPVSTY